MRRARATPKSRSLTCSRSPSGEEEVRRLDVAVDDAALVRGTERLGDAATPGRRLGAPRARRAQPRVEALALEPLHREPRLAASRRRRRRSARCPDGGAAASTRISRAKRSTCSTESARRTLIATGWPDSRSSARNTAPIPPVPATPSSRNRPATRSPSRTTESLTDTQLIDGDVRVVTLRAAP